MSGLGVTSALSHAGPTALVRYVYKWGTYFVLASYKRVCACG